MRLDEALDFADDDPHHVAFRAAEDHVAGDFAADGRDFPFRAFRKRQDFLRARLEQHAFLREAEGVVLPVEKFLAEPLLQLRHLARERRLREVQAPRGAGNVAFFGDGEEVAERAKFHGGVLSRGACYHAAAFSSTIFFRLT